jgi:alanine dehydrogenase
MQASQTPFSARELMPQEEMLEVSKRKSDMIIGLPKEISNGELRICLTPDSVNALTSNGHQVIIERNAGIHAGFEDNDYSEAGGMITSDREKIFSCPVVLKVSPPTLEEIDMLNPHSFIISALQLKMRKKAYFQKLAEKRITALAFEFIKDEHGGLPAVRALSEIAGTSSVLIASEILSSPKYGNGHMFGNTSGVPPTEVLILGAGTVGEFAARAALGLGANIKVFDSSLTKLRHLQSNLNHQVFTSTLQPKNLLKALRRCNVLIGAVRGMNRSPVLVSEDMVRQMKKGAVIIDVSIDMGGCVETSEVTSHEHPVFVKHDVIHYCVPNIPSRYAKTSSLSISNMFTPYLLEMGEKGGLENTLRFDLGLRNGLYFYHGVLTNKSVADWFDLSYRDANLLIF